jgi:phage baseplate assembly protein W
MQLTLRPTMLAVQLVIFLVKYKMATFIGFNTINQYKKFTVVDFELIKIDLLNAFNIKQGQLPGRPSYGTTLWDNIFENQSQETTASIYNEIQRVCAQDPRIYVSSTQVFPQQNGVLIQVGLATVAGTNAQQLAIFFNQAQGVAAFV